MICLWAAQWTRLSVSLQLSSLSYVSFILFCTFLFVLFLMDQRFSCVAQDEHGEVCPANWTKGSRTIKPDPVASLEYFAAQANDANEVHSNGETANGASKKRARVD
jgi:hypothetical protein